MITIKLFRREGIEDLIDRSGKGRSALKTAPFLTINQGIITQSCTIIKISRPFPESKQNLIIFKCRLQLAANQGIMPEYPAWQGI